MEYYDSIASGYDELHKGEQLNKLNIILDRIDTVEQPILDVGCGTGFSLDILHKTFNQPVTGLDPSKELIKQYKGKQHIVLGRAEKLPFPNDHFGLILSITAAQNFDDIIASIAEMRRVAAHKAIVVVTCLKQISKIEALGAHLAENFQVDEIIEEAKDLIFLCRKV